MVRTLIPSCLQWQAETLPHRTSSLMAAQCWMKVLIMQAKSGTAPWSMWMVRMSWRAAQSFRTITTMAMMAQVTGCTIQPGQCISHRMEILPWMAVLSRTAIRLVQAAESSQKRVPICQQLPAQSKTATPHGAAVCCWKGKQSFPAWLFPVTAQALQAVGYTRKPPVPLQIPWSKGIILPMMAAASVPTQDTDLNSSDALLPATLQAGAAQSRRWKGRGQIP